MVKLQVPEHVTDVWIFCDSDHGRAGQKAAEKLAIRLTGEGKTVHIVYPAFQPETGHAPKVDFNDLLQFDPSGQMIRDWLEAAVPYAKPPKGISDQLIAEIVITGKKGYGLIPGVLPTFGLGLDEALEAHRASEKLAREVEAFFADADRTVRANQAREAVEAARKEARDKVYAEWLADHPEWKEPQPPDDVCRKLAKKIRNITPIMDMKNVPVVRVQLCATAGIGKTRGVMDALENELWRGRNVDYYVPTHILAEDLEKEAKNRDIPVQVIYGRNSDNCAKPTAAYEAGQCGLNVMSSLCDDGTLKCPNFGTCQYLAQFNDTQPCLRIFTHDMLFLPRSSRLPKPDLIIVDENIAQKAVSQTSFHPDRLDTTGRTIIQNHLENGTPLKEALAAEGITKETAEQKAKELDEEVKILIHPNMPEKMALDSIAKLREKSNRATAAFWRQVAKEWEFDREFNGIEVVKDYKIFTGKEKELQNRIIVMSRKKVKRSKNTPVLLIDADANINVNRLLFGKTMRAKNITAKLNAHVIQVHSSVFTKRSLLTDDDLIEKVKNFIIEEVDKADGGGVLVVTSKKVRELITGQEANGDFGRPIIETKWQGAAITHFGAILGVDIWKDYKTVIVLGREQPWPADIERMARALYWDSEELLNLPGKFNKAERGYRMIGGQELGVTAHVHPDARVQDLLELIRERQSGQALARLRMVHSVEKKRVVLMCNLPLDIEVDELVTTKELFAGGSPLTQAWEQLPGVLPLSPAWLVEEFPHLFGSTSRVRRLLANDEVMSHFAYSINTESNLFVFRLKGNRGKLMRCLSIHDVSTTHVHLEQLFEKKVDVIVGERVKADSKDNQTPQEEPCQDKEEITVTVTDVGTSSMELTLNWDDNFLINNGLSLFIPICIARDRKLDVKGKDYVPILASG